MLESLKKNVVLPMASRVGTLIAGMLIPYGVHAQSAEMLTTGIIGVGLVAIDLVVARMNRNKVAGS